MATAYATIASGGYRNRPTAITKVEFPGHKHSELPRRWRPHRTKVFSDGVTYEATKILEANIQGGTGTHANIGCPAGGKTGTTDNNTDAWFVGFTPRLATAVWVGYPNDRRYMTGLYFGRNVDGGTFPADICGEYMKSIIGGFCGPFAQPKEAFQSRPFFGQYSSTGRDRLGLGTGKDEAPSTSQEPQPNTDNQQQDNTGGGTQFDPDAYESPPQGPPKTEPVTPQATP
jgi:penicillin-binding protein 1A